MADVTRADVEQALTQFIDPYLKQDYLSCGAVKEIQLDGNRLSVSLQLGYPVQTFLAPLKMSVQKVLQRLEGLEHINIDVQTKISARAVQQGNKPLAGVKNIIAVASGKGGVGKSTTCVNLALALQQEGARVGILDADIYGPNQPTMLGAHQAPRATDQKHLAPVVSHGLQSMSMGYLIAEETPMVWRGPMVSTALQQLLRDTQWDNLDYLLIDLPPGTGDVQITLAQKIPVSGAVVVTTPQDIALSDVRKAVTMFNKVKVPVLGVVENMSTYVCPNCEHEEAIFGEQGAALLAKEFKLDVLGKIPLHKNIRADVDQGTPTVVASPKSKHASVYRNIARRVAAQLSLQAKDYASKFPEIVVQSD